MSKNPTALRIITLKSDLYAAGNAPDIAVEVPQLWDPFGKQAPMVEPVRDEAPMSRAQLAAFDRAMGGAVYGDGLSCLEADRRAGLGEGY